MNSSTIGRLLSGGLGLFLALIYSDFLGIEKRSVLSFVLVTSLLATLVTASSFSARYKKIALKSQIKDSIHLAYLVWCLLLSSLVGIFVLSASMLYSRVISYLAPNLLIVVFIYSIVSTLSFCLQDFLPTLGKFKAAVIIDISLVIFQLISFLFIVSVDELSTIVAVLLSLIFSYMLHISSISSLILFNRQPISICSDLKKLTQVKQLFLASTAIHVVDRIDKVAIAFFLPLATLAQFTTMAAFFTPIKTVTEGATRQLYFSRKPDRIDARVKSRSSNFVFYPLLVCFILLIPFLVAVLVNFLIASLLGENWLLPTHLVALYFLYEVIRGIYLYLTNYRIIENKYGYSRKAPISLLAISLILVPISVLNFGLVGALVATITSYGLVLAGMKFANAF